MGVTVNCAKLVEVSGFYQKAAHRLFPKMCSACGRKQPASVLDTVIDVGRGEAAAGLAVGAGKMLNEIAQTTSSIVTEGGWALPPQPNPPVFSPGTLNAAGQVARGLGQVTTACSIYQDASQYVDGQISGGEAVVDISARAALIALAMTGAGAIPAATLGGGVAVAQGIQQHHNNSQREQMQKDACDSSRRVWDQTMMLWSLALALHETCCQ